MCDGPPCIQRRMQRMSLRLNVSPAKAFILRNCGSAKPRAESAPTRRNERRVTPVQSGDEVPVLKSNIGRTPWRAKAGGKSGGKAEAAGGLVLVSCQNNA